MQNDTRSFINKTKSNHNKIMHKTPFVGPNRVWSHNSIDEENHFNKFKKKHSENGFPEKKVFFCFYSHLKCWMFKCIIYCGRCAMCIKTMMKNNSVLKRAMNVGFSHQRIQWNSRYKSYKSSEYKQHTAYGHSRII